MAQPRPHEPEPEVEQILADAAARKRAREQAATDGYSKAMTVDDVVAVYRRYLHLPDAGSVTVTLAAVAANLIEGDPVWLLLVGPPGGGKTETLNPLAKLPNAHAAATITEAALLSGTPARDKAKGASGGLLREIGEFGLIILKDFTSVLSMHRDARAVTLAALREVYDGSWTRYVGVDGGKKLHWSGKVGLLAGCTPAIDSHHAVMASMGERFLLYRMGEVAADDLADFALSGGGSLRTMREDMAAAATRLFASRPIPREGEKPTPEEKAYLVNLAVLACRCRSAVERDGRTREIDLILDTEAPGRIVRALAQLLAGCKALGVSGERALPLLRKVALDCVPAIRRRCIEVLAGQGGAMTTADVATRIDHPTVSARRALEDLACHKVVKRSGGGQGKEIAWALTEDTERRLAALR